MKRLADLVAWMHFFWVVLGIASLPLLFLVNWWSKVVLIYVGINFFYWVLARNCLFLELELYLRKQNNPQNPLEGHGFMEYYLKKLFNFSLSRSTIILAQRVYLGLMVTIALIQIVGTI